jgi:hypothetical protein
MLKNHVKNAMPPKILPSSTRICSVFVPCELVFVVTRAGAKDIVMPKPQGDESFEATPQVSFDACGPGNCSVNTAS